MSILLAATIRDPFQLLVVASLKDLLGIDKILTSHFHLLPNRHPARIQLQEDPHILAEVDRDNHKVKHFNQGIGETSLDSEIERDTGMTLITTLVERGLTIRKVPIIMTEKRDTIEH